MTVTYIQHVHTSGKVGAFLRLLTIWKGSVFKGIWRDLLIYCVLYGGISIIYRLGLSKDGNETHKQNFERMCVYFARGGDYIPLSFILGFYVNQVVNRWWLQFSTIPWSDNLAFALATYLPGTGRESRIRKRVIRLATLANILALRRISTGIARRFPTYKHFQEAGLLTETELGRLEEVIEGAEEEYQVSWLPIKWALTSLRKAKAENMISSDLTFSKLEERLEDLSVKNRDLLLYGWVNIPLVYTQLVTIAVNVYFLVALFGRQHLTPTKFLGSKGTSFYPVDRTTPNAVNLVGYDDTKLDVYVPFFTLLQFIFYFGWLKVAEIMINPFGDDDDDFDANHIVDVNYERSKSIVQDDVEVEEEQGEEQEEDDLPDTLPHTLDSYKHMEAPVVLPTDGMVVGEGEDKRSLLPLHGCNSRRVSVMSCQNAWRRNSSLISSREGRKVSLPRLIISSNRGSIDKVGRDPLHLHASSTAPGLLQEEAFFLPK